MASKLQALTVPPSLVFDNANPQVATVRFLGELVIYGAIMGAAAMAVITVAKRVRRRVRPRMWIGSAIGCALAVAILGWSSRDLTQQCLAERNGGCVDLGGTGTQFLIVVGYIIFALSSAFMLARD